MHDIYVHVSGIIGFDVFDKINLEKVHQSQLSGCTHFSTCRSLNIRRADNWKKRTITTMLLISCEHFIAPYKLSLCVFIYGSADQ